MFWCPISLFLFGRRLFDSGLWLGLSVSDLNLVLLFGIHLWCEACTPGTSRTSGLPPTDSVLVVLLKSYLLTPFLTTVSLWVETICLSIFDSVLRLLKIYY